MKSKLEASSTPWIPSSLIMSVSRCELPHFESFSSRAHPGEYSAHRFENVFSFKPNACIIALKEFSFTFAHLIELVDRFSSPSKRTSHSFKILPTPSKRQCIRSNHKIFYTSTHRGSSIEGNFDITGKTGSIDLSANLVSISISANLFLPYVFIIVVVLFNVLLENEVDLCNLFLSKRHT